MNKRFLSDKFRLSVAVAVVSLGMSLCAFAQGTETVLHAFSGGADGGHPTAGLVFNPSGDLFGVTTKGGNQKCGGYYGGCGTVFELTLNNSGRWTEKQVLMVPGGVSGDDPVGIAADASGNLYITESQKGLHNDGQVVELSPDGHGGWIKSLVHAFSGSDGFYPEGVTLDGVGNLYGMTQTNANTGNYGLVFKLSKNTSGQWIDQTLFTFDSSSGGSPDDVTLALDRSGNLYGTTVNGGGSTGCGNSGGCGIVFQLSPTSDGGVNETLLHSFTGYPDGYFPWGNLIVDAAGNVFGTTLLGGQYDNGVVFELSPQSGGSWQETILYNFTGGADGDEPNGLTFDAAGNIYGSSYTGVFELSPNGSDGWNETTLYAANGREKGGNGFIGAPVLDASGNVYGITEYGGLINDCRHPGGGCGVIYEIKP